MNKASVMNAGVILASGTLGCSWLWYLFWLDDGKGLVNMDARTLIVDLVLMGILGLVGFAISTDIALSAVVGWLGGQIIFLVWEGMPHGRSPHMFQPTNVGESFLLALVVVVVLNWPIVVGAVLGSLLRYALSRNRKVKARSKIK